MTQTLTTPITADDLRAANLLTTDIRSGVTGVLLLPAGKLNWALHNSWEGDHAGLAAWLNDRDDHS